MRFTSASLLTIVAALPLLLRPVAGMNLLEALEAGGYLAELEPPQVVSVSDESGATSTTSLDPSATTAMGVNAKRMAAGRKLNKPKRLFDNKKALAPRASPGQPDPGVPEYTFEGCVDVNTGSCNGGCENTIQSYTTLQQCQFYCSSCPYGNCNLVVSYAAFAGNRPIACTCVEDLTATTTCPQSGDPNFGNSYYEKV